MLFTILGWIIAVVAGLGFVAVAFGLIWWEVHGSTSASPMLGVWFFALLAIAFCILHYAYVNSPFEIALRAVP